MYFGSETEISRTNSLAPLSIRVWIIQNVKIDISQLEILGFVNSERNEWITKGEIEKN